MLREHPTATRSVPRNTPAGRNIGAPVSATDADNDALTYSLGGPDGNSFDVGTSSGQLLTKAPLDRRYKTSYTVFVSVSDGKDDDGMPETSSQIDTTTRVTIKLGGTSGGGTGGSSWWQQRWRRPAAAAALPLRQPQHRAQRLRRHQRQPDRSSPARLPLSPA